MLRNADPRLILVLGGARSGKSRYAEVRAQASGLSLCYVATAEAGDGEMAERIAQHRARRGRSWRTVEAPLDLPDAVRVNSCPNVALLVDCLTLWLSNLMFANRDMDVELERLVAALAEAGGTIILVSNEVGLGIVPENPLARRFRDAAGAANQRLAEVADEVVLVAAGLPLVLKGIADERA